MDRLARGAGEKGGKAAHIARPKARPIAKGHTLRKSIPDIETGRIRCRARGSEDTISTMPQTTLRTNETSARRGRGPTQNANQSEGGNGTAAKAEHSKPTATHKRPNRKHPKNLSPRRGAK